MHFNTSGERDASLEERMQHTPGESDLSLEELFKQDETASQFSDSLPNMEQALKLFDGIFFSMSGEQEFGYHPEGHDGVMLDLAYSRGVSTRNLRRKLNEGGPDFARDYINNLGRSSEKADVTTQPAFQKMQYAADTLQQYFSTKETEAKRDVAQQPLYHEPEFRAIDEKLAQNEITIPEANMERDKLLPVLEERKLQQTMQEYLHQELPSLPYEAQLYTQAVSLALGSTDYQDAKEQFHSFYLQTATNYAKEQSGSLPEFKQALLDTTGYSASYLPKAMKGQLGCSCSELYWN